MKPKTVRGSGFRGLLDYQFRVGKPPEIRAKAKLIYSNMAGETPRELAREFGQARKLRIDIRKPVWHCSLNLPAGEVLSDEKWQEVTDAFLKKMEVPEENQFCIIRHSDTNYDHVHIALNRINLSGGRVWSYANDVYRAIDACQELEKEFDLTLTPGLDRKKQKKKSEPKLTYKEMRMIERTGEPSAKMKVKAVLDGLFQEGKTYNPQEFCQALEKQGITPIPNIARTGKMNGFAFRAGDIEVKAGKCGWPWKKMSQHIEMSEIGITFLQQKREEAMNELQRENFSDANATGTEETGAENNASRRTDSPEFSRNERKLVSTPEIVDESGDKNLGNSLQRGKDGEGRNSKTEMEKNMPDSGIRSGDSSWDGVLDTVSILARNSGTPLESSHSGRNVKKKSISVQKKEAAWARQSRALGAEFYRITLVERGPAARRMNLGKGKGENGKEKFYTAEEVKNMIPKLEFWNARGNDIYVTPIDADYHFILIDDLPLEGKKYVEENYSPVLVQTSSKNNWQAVIKVPRAEPTKEEQSCANILMKKINVEAGGDSKISAVVHPFRMAGFCNKKPSRNNEYTRILAANPDAISVRAEKELEEIRAERKAEAEKVERERRENAIRTTENIRENRNIVRPDEETILDFHFREIWNQNQKFAEKMIENGNWQKIDYSALDFRTVKELLRKGYEPEKIEEALTKCSPALASRHSGDYVFRTIQAALDSLYTEERKQKPKKEKEMEVEQFWEPTL